MTRALAIVILAAGKGTRMKSKKPKVLHELAGFPMLGHVIRAMESAAPQKLILVLSPGREDVVEAARGWVADPAMIAHAVQDPPQGTGHAVMVARDHFETFDGDVLVTFGDTPLVTAETVAAMIAARDGGADIVVSGFRATGDHMYGRLVTDADGALQAIVEHKDADAQTRLIDLCNGGLMLIAGDKIGGLLDQLTTDNAQGEYYLTDIVAHARAEGLICAVAECPYEDVLGINARTELAAAEAILQDRLRAAAMAGGATLIDPQSVFLSTDTVLGRDVLVEPNVVFGPGVTVGDDVTIRAFSHLEGATLEAGVTVGPYARLRPGAVLEEGARIGNFVEVKKSRLGKGAKANHLAYLGDADIGAGANIGAGTITCNYDGFDKHKTVVGENSFVGSNSTLVAPVEIEKDAFVAAGSTITKTIKSGALGLGRARQSEIAGWVTRFRDRKDRKKS